MVNFSALKFPLHLFLYSGLFGSTCYQSFYAGITAYRVLPIEMFSKLQNSIFPGYFTLQAVLSALLLVTAPYKPTKLTRGSLGFSLAASLFNLVFILPKTNTIVAERNLLVEKEGKNWKDPTASDEMKQLNKQFAKYHGLSMLANLGLIASVFTYGFGFSAAVAVPARAVARR